MGFNSGFKGLISGTHSAGYGLLYQVLVMVQLVKKYSSLMKWEAKRVNFKVTLLTQL